MLTTSTKIARLALIAGSLAAGGAAMGFASVAEWDHHAQADNPTIVEIAAGNADFSTLVTAVKAADLVETLNSDGPFTVFAPTNDAFAKLDQRALANTLEDKERLTQILTFHVVPGRITAEQLATTRFLNTVNGNRVEIGRNGGLGIEQASIVAANIEAGNGIIHVIDEVLVPTKQDIVETAATAGSFETLIAAAKAAGLAGYLKSDGPLTVFAPTDEAFAKIPAETLEALLRPENKNVLAQILKYHVSLGRTYSNSLLGGAEIETLAGETIDASFASNGLTLNGTIGFNATDLGTTNGVIHVIDEVLIPESVAEFLGTLDNPLRSTSDPVVASIAGAIDRGAPLFNDDQVGRCAAVYLAAAESLVNYKAFGATDEERRLLEAAIERAAHQSDRDAAWTVRRVFDRILQQRVGAANEAAQTAQRDNH